MSENKSNQDSIEQNSLDFIKKNLHREDCFGLSDQQFIQLKRWLESAQLNTYGTKFPDIVFDNGFIEHLELLLHLRIERELSKQENQQFLKRKRD